MTPTEQLPTRQEVEEALRDLKGDYHGDEGQPVAMYRLAEVYIAGELLPAPHNPEWTALRRRPDQEPR